MMKLPEGAESLGGQQSAICDGVIDIAKKELQLLAEGFRDLGNRFGHLQFSHSYSIYT
jgi:hypothetical protein